MSNLLLVLLAELSNWTFRLENVKTVQKCVNCKLWIGREIIMPPLFIEELQLGNTCGIFDQSNCPVSDATHTGPMHAFLDTFRLTNVKYFAAR